MGYVPTHGPSCYKVHSYLTHCSSCGEPIVYFECSCGSKVFFDPPDEGLHECGKVTGARRAERATLLLDMLHYASLDPDGNTECPMCGVVLKNAGDRPRKHFKRCLRRKEWFPFEE
jgi:hypothetical protein